MPARFVVGVVQVFTLERVGVVLRCLSTIVLLVLGRGQVAQRRVPPLVVVEHLDVLEDAGLGFGPGLVVLMVRQFLFEAGKKALHWCVVPALTHAAHAALDTVLGEELLVVAAGILAAAVAMCQ